MWFDKYCSEYYKNLTPNHKDQKTQSHAVVFMVWPEEIQAESYSTLQIYAVKLQWKFTKVPANQSLTEFPKCKRST